MGCRNALRFGLNNSMPSQKVQKDKIKVSVEQLVHSLKKNPFDNFNDGTQNELKFLLRKFVDEKYS